MATGKVVQIIGTVVDVEFAAAELPAIYNALEIGQNGEKLVLEVEQHIGNNWVRCLALGATEGLSPRRRSRGHRPGYRRPRGPHLSRPPLQRHRRDPG